MKTISVPISEARTGLRRLIEQVMSGKVRVLVTDHGAPKAQIVPWLERGAPWRAEQPDDPAHYGDLQSPVMEDWK
ncbi:MAG: type II toxin-antitoxin system Phd/YefM family antitoxin [Verrucomicrobia bacterium]|nr:type II toxin-antitoxin system Phd/YefM family antitoxin [Verrucomicrobiota bacterium]